MSGLNYFIIYFYYQICLFCILVFLILYIYAYFLYYILNFTVLGFDFHEFSSSFLHLLKAPWISLKLLGFSLKLLGFSWISLNLLESFCTSLDFSGFPCISLDCLRFPWIFLCFPGLSWISLNILTPFFCFSQFIYYNFLLFFIGYYRSLLAILLPVSTFTLHFDWNSATCCFYNFLLHFTPFFGVSQLIDAQFLWSSCVSLITTADELIILARAVLG